MLHKVFDISEKTFDRLKNVVEGQFTTKIISSTLVLVFILAIIISFLTKGHYINLGSLNKAFNNPFFAIEIVFTLLLIVELLSLIFVLPKSVAKSVGKQFELLSLIFIRAGFKEFGHLHDIHVSSTSPELYHMSAYALGALVIFILMGVSYKLQMHTKLTVNEADQHRFVQAKKLLSLLLFVAFIIIGIYDSLYFIKASEYLHSFDKFYTVLIFSDIIIVLIALRYTLSYLRIFRYSAFVLATIFIRLALTSEIYYNIIIGVFASVYVLILTVFYNYFLNAKPNSDLE